MNVSSIITRHIAALGGVLNIDGEIRINDKLYLRGKLLKDYLQELSEGQLHTWVKYSPNSNGLGLTSHININSKFIGLSFNNINENSIK